MAASEPSCALGKNWMSMRPFDCCLISAQAASMAFEEGWLSANCPPTLRSILPACAIEGAAHMAAIDPIVVAPN
jgi:hypothetical protein